MRALLRFVWDDLFAFGHMSADEKEAWLDSFV